MKTIITITLFLLLAGCVDAPSKVVIIEDTAKTNHKRRIDSLDRINENMHNVVLGQIKAIGKQHEFEGAMNLSELRYQLNGDEKDYKAYYRHRDSLIKWIKYKDSIEKSVGLYIKDK